MLNHKITFLGTKGGPSLNKGTSWPTSMALEVKGRLYVIDCGLGVTRQLSEAGYKLGQVETIFLTHLHSDHTLELGGLIHTTWTSSPAHPIKVIGPPGTDKLLEGHFIAQDFDIEIRVSDEKQADLRELVSCEIYEEGEIYSDDLVKVSALRVQHPPVHHCYALKFETADRTIVFGADTCYFPPLAEFAKGADVLIHEVMNNEGAMEVCKRMKDVKPHLWEHFVASHTPCEDVGRIATQAEVGQLILNHFLPSDNPAYPPERFVEEVAKTFKGPITASHDLFAIEV